MKEWNRHPATIKTIASVQGLLKRGIALDCLRDFEYRVQLSIDKDLAETANGQMALVMAANLLSRMAPLVTHLEVLVPERIPLRHPIPLLRGDELKFAVSSFLRDIRCGTHVRVSSTPSIDPDVILAMGEMLDPLAEHVSIASEGWLAHVSWQELHGRIDCSKINPMGAYAAACLGAAEVCRSALLSVFPRETLVKPILLARDPLSFSTFTYGVNNALAPNPDLPEGIGLGATSIIGVGAGGGAVVYLLASLSNLCGRLALVDPDEINHSNLNRYIHATQMHANQQVSKVELGRRLLAHHACLEVLPLDASYDQGVTALRRAGYLDLLVSTVDTGIARREIQQDLPRVILDAAVTSRGEYLVARIDLGVGPCLECLHPPGAEPSNEEVAWSHITGLPLEEVIHLKKNNARFEQDHLDIIAQNLGGCFIPSLHDRWSDWVQQQCGRLQLNPQVLLEIPIPFSTALPGILVGGEIIKERCFPAYRLNNVLYHDLLSLPTRHYPASRIPREDCRFCQDGDALALYHKRYPGQAL